MKLSNARIVFNTDDGSIASPVEVVLDDDLALDLDDFNDFDMIAETPEVKVAFGEDHVEPVVETPPIVEDVEPKAEPVIVEPTPVVDEVVAVEPVTPVVEPAVVESAPAVAPELTETESLKSQVAVLTAALNNMASGQLPVMPIPGTLPLDPSVLPGVGAIPTQLPPVQPVMPHVQAAPVVPQRSLTEIYADTDFNEVLNSKEGFLGFMQEISDAAEGRATERATIAMAQQSQAAELVTKFYEDNAVLTPVKGYVGQVAGQLQQQYPQADTASILAHTAVIVKRQLNITDAVIPPVVPNPAVTEAAPVAALNPNPVLPGAGSGTRQAATPKSDLQADIDDLFDIS